MAEETVDVKELAKRVDATMNKVAWVRLQPDTRNTTGTGRMIGRVAGGPLEGKMAFPVTGQVWWHPEGAILPMIIEEEREKSVRARLTTSLQVWDDDLRHCVAQQKEAMDLTWPTDLAAAKVLFKRLLIKHIRLSMLEAVHQAKAAEEAEAAAAKLKAELMARIEDYPVELRVYALGLLQMSWGELEGDDTLKVIVASEELDKLTAQAKQLATGIHTATAKALWEQLVPDAYPWPVVEVLPTLAIPPAASPPEQRPRGRYSFTL